MELYRIYKSDLKDSIKVARTVSGITGQSTLYHLDCCIVCDYRYGIQGIWSMGFGCTKSNYCGNSGNCVLVFHQVETNQDFLVAII